MEIISIPYKTVKGTWNNSLLKKIKSFEKTELRSCLKNGRRQWNKRVNTLFNKVLGENEKCVFYFYLKTEGTFWPTLSIYSIWSNVLFKVNFSLLIFCLDDQSIEVIGVLMSPTIFVLLSISPFIFVNICFKYSSTPILGVYIYLYVTVINYNKILQLLYLLIGLTP